MTARLEWTPFLEAGCLELTNRDSSLRLWRQALKDAPAEPTSKVSLARPSVYQSKRSDTLLGRERANLLAASRLVHPSRRILHQGVVQNLGRVLGDTPGAVFDLVPAARARCGDNCVGRSRAHRRQKDELANLH